MIDSCCFASVRLFPHYTILGFLPGFLRSSGGCTSAPAHAALLRAVRSAVPPSFFSSIPSSCIEPPNHAVSTPTMMV